MCSFLGGNFVILTLGEFKVSFPFKDIKDQKSVEKGNFFALFNNKDRLSRYLKCIGIGLPTWFVIGILATFSNEFGQALGIAEQVKPGLSIMWCYVGLSVGDLASGFISHWLESRKKAVFYLMIFTLAASYFYLYGGVKTAANLYAVATVLGFGIGYWAMFVTIGAEQFGTNLRATAATTVPNMVRGTVVLMTTLFASFKESFSVVNSGALVGVICFAIGLFCILTIPETHGRDLDFLEE